MEHKTSRSIIYSSIRRRSLAAEISRPEECKKGDRNLRPILAIIRRNMIRAVAARENITFLFKRRVRPEATHCVRRRGPEPRPPEPRAPLCCARRVEFYLGPIISARRKWHEGFVVHVRGRSPRDSIQLSGTMVTHGADSSRNNHRHRCVIDAIVPDTTPLVFPTFTRALP